MKKVDVHNHVFPVEWMTFLENRTGSPSMRRTGPTTAIFYYADKPLSHINRPGHYDVEARIEDLERYGIDTQMLSLTTPSVELVPADEGITWAKKVNDSFAATCQKYKDRFYALATLPFQSPDACVKELERAYKELGVKGITMFSNINGRQIYSPEFYPVYEMAQALDLPIFIHPAPPITTEILKSVHMPPPLYGFILDTTIAVTGLIFHGVLEKFRNLKIIHAHLGGVFPYMVGRINGIFTDNLAGEYGYSLPELPSAYYKRQVYVDCVSFHLPALRCALEFLGSDHLLLGTDYPHPLGGAEGVIQSIEDLHLPAEDLEKIFSRNAMKLFKLAS